jgi:radical SAM superfamily enzyme YgiQ (UPF0313 family)
LLSSYVNDHFGENVTDVLDLNIKFYNKVCHNEYINFNKDMDISSAVEYFFKIEQKMESEMNKFSSHNNVILTRQSLLFNFDRFKSEEVYNYLQSKTSFIEFIIELFNNYVDLKYYNFVGINISCQDQLIPAFIIAKYIKDTTNVCVIIGGNIISRCFNGIIKSKLKRYFDFLVYKEGELALCNIIHYMYNSELFENFKANAIYSSISSSIIDYITIPNVLDINSIPFIRFNSIIENKYFAPELILPVFFSRGCHWKKCSFCGIHNSWNANYRHKTSKQFCDELEFYINTYNCTNFRIIDESPDIIDIVTIINEIIKRNLNINIELYLNISKELLDKNIVQKLSKAGIKQIFFGIESISTEVLSSMNKNINNPSLFTDILNNTHINNIHNYAFFLIGYPTDNEINEKELENFIIETNSIGTVSIASFVPIIGTDIVNDKNITDSYGIKYVLKGDLTNKCNYTINDIDVSQINRIRTKKIVKSIMSTRYDLRVSSKMPYETRFYMCLQYGNDFGKMYVPSNNVIIDNNLSKEQEGRAIRPE